jgi:outer membrane receptor protein involved in Fe transport
VVRGRNLPWPNVLGALVSLALAASAQEPTTGAIRGSVHDADFDVPLVGAQVLVLETGQKTATTDQGNFVFERVAAGKVTLVFTKEGYVRQVKPDVLVTAGRLTDVRVELPGEFTELDEFLVQDVVLGGGQEAALLRLRLESPALLDSISSDLMSRAGASDAASALRLVAGASVQDGKTAVIRGLPDRYVSSQMNGVRLPTADEDKRAVELDQFPATIIDSLQVSKTFTPDQQGDASGGAVNVKLKGLPDDPFFIQFSSQVSWNTQVAGRSDFLTYRGGGIDFWGQDDGGRDIQHDRIGQSWEGAVGVDRGQAPIDSKWSTAGGGKYEFDNGLKVGGFGSFFYERDSSFFDNGVEDSWWVERPGAPMTPEQFQGTRKQMDFKTALFDVTQAQESVQWGGLGALSAEIEHHAVNLLYLYTRTAEDTVTLAEDTRGKQFFFPGYDPANPSTPGHEERLSAPWLRLETLNYTERVTDTLQLSGRHRFPVHDLGPLRAPEVDWTLARSSALLDQPDKRQFGSLWVPGIPGVVPPRHGPFFPSANINLGNLQRIWKSIEEESSQYFGNLKLPFEQWSGQEGYLKLGLFADDVDRTFQQETFSNFGDSGSFYEGEWQEYWSRQFPSETHVITGSTEDVDYTGEQQLSALYSMLDLPFSSTVRLIGGARFEKTEIGIVNHPEENAMWLPEGATQPVQLNPGDADVDFEQHDVLPAIGLVVNPFPQVTLRGSWSRTVARQTFKEITPILQQEFLGGPIFIGNPELGMSDITNYDVRADWTPLEGTLLSASWFHKNIRDPIEYVQRIASFTFTTARNYPKGELSGWELEGRQDLGRLWEAVEGLAVGANATLIDSEVTLPDDEAAGFELPNIQAPMKKRDMTGAPEHLFNAYVTYDLAPTGTQFALFWTLQGDTLVAGAGQSRGNFVPSIYAKQYDTLNFSVAQRIGRFLKLQFQAKNLTNPHIETVYRSQYIDDDVTRSSFTRGIEYSLTLSADFRF